MKRFVVVLAFVALTQKLFSQGIGDAFLGQWKLRESSAKIEIVEEQGSYYIIEFVNLKYELFFSPDGKRALFYAWGKGEPHPVVISIGEGTITMYGLSDQLHWVPNMVFYHWQ